MGSVYAPGMMQGDALPEGNYLDEVFSLGSDCECHDSYKGNAIHPIPMEKTSEPRDSVEEVSSATGTRPAPNHNLATEPRSPAHVGMVKPTKMSLGWLASLRKLVGKSVYNVAVSSGLILAHVSSDQVRIAWKCVSQALANCSHHADNG